MQETWFVGPDDEPDRYRLGEQIGSGGEAQLWEAWVSLAGGQERVAVKILHGDHAGSFDTWRKRWDEQVTLLRLIEHPSVVRVHDSFAGGPMHVAGRPGRGARTLYMVMNWIDGQDLRAWVPEHSGAAHRTQALRRLQQVADVLDHLHEGRATDSGRPVLHGDITPGNVVVPPSGQAVLVDFGLFRVVGHVTAVPIGTRGYCAPEVTTRGEYSVASDRYAFGGLAFYVLTGEHPPEDLAGVAARLAERTDQPPEIARALTPCFAADPGLRPSCREVMSLLHKHTSTVIPPDGPQPREEGQAGRRAGRPSARDGATSPGPSAPPSGAHPAKPATVWLAAGLAVALIAVVALVGVVVHLSANRGGSPAAPALAHVTSAPTRHETSLPPTSAPQTSAPPSPTASVRMSMLTMSPISGDVGFDVGAQTVNTKRYENAMAADSECGSSAEWQLNRKYHRLDADIGVGDTSDDGASFVFSATGDGKNLGQQAVQLGHDPKHVVFDVTGVFRLTLSTDPSKDCLESSIDATSVWIDPELS